MSTEETTTIDEKKEDESTTTKKPDWPEFLKKLGAGLITGILIGVVVVGSAGLFLAKVANANILPTDFGAQPYTPGYVRKVPIDLIYMNPVKKLDFFGLGFWDAPTSYVIQEANFVNSPDMINFMDAFKNTWLCSLFAKANPTQPKKGDTGKPLLKSAFWTFEYEALKGNLWASFNMVQTIFFYLNYLPEWATMILFALLFSIILPLIGFGNLVYSFFSHISKISTLFNNLFYPESLNSGEELSGFFNNLFTIPVFCVYLTAAFWSAILSPAFITLYTLFKALSANYLVRRKDGQTQPPQKMNLFDFIKNVLYYKKTLIIVLVMFNLMGVTNEYLGSSYMPGVVIAMLILIFGMKILETDVPEELYKVSQNAVFPSLSQEDVGLEEDALDFCAPKKVDPTVFEQQENRTGVTNQPYDVLKSVQTGGSGFKGKSGFKGGSAKKVKMYNIQLV